MTPEKKAMCDYIARARIDLNCVSNEIAKEWSIGYAYTDALCNRVAGRCNVSVGFVALVEQVLYYAYSQSLTTPIP